MSGSRKGKGAASKPPRFEGVVREASEADMASAQDIYGHYVSTSLATIEETPATLEEMLARRKKSIEAGLAK
jgi:L-amino acid N-acyltransferase YncA